MKYSTLTIITCIFAVSVGTAYAQSSDSEDGTSVTEQTVGFEMFEGVDAGDSFKISYEKASGYSVRWEVNENLKDYVEVYVKGGILYMEVNRKGIPSDVKKLYKAKNAPEVVLNAIVCAPTLSSISIRDNVELMAKDDAVLAVDSLHVIVAGNADFNNLAISGKNVTVESCNKADVSAPVTAERVTLIASNTSNLSGSVNCNALTVTGRNTSTLKVSGKAETVTVNGQNREVDILALSVPKAELVLSNACRAYVAASQILSLDMKGGSLASFSGDPVIEIVSVQNSSVQHYSGEKKK